MRPVFRQYSCIQMSIKRRLRFRQMGISRPNVKKTKIIAGILLTIYLVFYFTRIMFLGSVADGGKMATQADVDYIGESLKVQFDVLRNLEEREGSNAYVAKITLTNTGWEFIKPGKDWKIYFYSIREVEPHTDTIAGVKVPTNMIVNHVNGLLYTIAPTSDFEGIKAGDSLEVTYYASASNAARSDNFPNWYVASHNTQPRVLKSTEGVDAHFVSKFDTPEKYRNRVNSTYAPYTPDQRFEINKMEDLEGAPIPVIPTPKEIEIDNNGETVNVDSALWVVVADSNLQKEAKFLSDSLRAKQSSTPPADHYIKLDSFLSPESSKDESYALDVNPSLKAIVINGNPPGVFYGVQTLLGLLNHYKDKLPKLHIKDTPRLPYRGLMLDVARNFHSKETIFQLLDAMAMYKLNKFHFHLSDDEGWRLEIPALPELTEVGGKRGHDLEEESCLLPQLGSGPVADGLGCGYYTVQDYKDILQYAADRHIEVIPEIDLPGHSHAAIKAMELRRKRYLTAGDEKRANEFLLSDPGDKSKYRSIQGYRDNVVNPGLESTFQFLRQIMLSLIEMHQDIRQLKTLHFGGDEVPTDTWSQSPACHKIKNDHPKVNVRSRTSIMEYFLRRATDMASQLGLNIQSWEDAFYVGRTTPHRRKTFPADIDLITNIWKNTWDYGKAHHFHDMANGGYKVVLSPATHLYLDHPHEPDPEDRGLYWATRFIDTRKVYNFQPDDFYDNIDVDLTGRHLNKEKYCAEHQCSNLKETKNLLGIQAQLWTETVRTQEQLQAMLFPRIVAMAERAWHKAPWESDKDKAKKEKLKKESYEQFANTLGYRELERLEKMGIKFHLPLPGVRIENGLLKVNTAYPGLKVQYSSNEGKTWNAMKSYAKLAGTIYVSTASYDRSRRSRPIKIDMK